MNKLCNCGSGQYSESLFDARGIYCCQVCPKCEDDQRAKYRTDIFVDANYWSDEPIEAD